MINSATCTRCKITKELSEFSPSKEKRNGRTSRCKQCIRDAANKKNARIQRQHPRYCPSCKTRKLAKFSQICASCRKNGVRKAIRYTTKAESKRYRDKLKNDVFQHYGGMRCECCGETEPAFLSIDHINNDGSWHRKSAKVGSGSALYYWLRKNNYPPGFRVPCMNCNLGRRHGICPHKKENQNALSARKG